MKNYNKKQFELTKEQEQKAINEIMHYFEKERNEKIGNMDALTTLTFIKEKIAPFFYNCGVTDAQKLMEKKTDELYDLVIWD